MSVHPNDVYVNSRLTLNGADVTVVDSNGSVVAVAQDDGEVKHYTHDSFIDKADLYEPPAEAEQSNVPAPSPPEAPALTEPVPPATTVGVPGAKPVPPATTVGVPDAPEAPQTDSERVAWLQQELDSIRSRQRQQANE